MGHVPKSREISRGPRAIMEKETAHWQLEGPRSGGAQGPFPAGRRQIVPAHCRMDSGPSIRLQPRQIERCVPTHEFLQPPRYRLELGDGFKGQPFPPRVVDI